MYGPQYEVDEIKQLKNIRNNLMGKNKESNSIPILNNEILTLGDKRVGRYNTIYDFLANFNVIGSIIGVAIGFAFQNIVKSLTRDIVMPVFEPLFGTLLGESGIKIGYANLYFGKFVSEFIYFLITIFVIYLILMKLFGSYVNIVIHKMKTPERDYRIQSTVLLNKMNELDKRIYNSNKNNYNDNLESIALVNSNMKVNSSDNIDYPLTNSMMDGDNNAKYTVTNEMISSKMPSSNMPSSNMPNDQQIYY